MACQRQAAFRDTAAWHDGAARTPTDEFGQRRGHLLALGSEDANLHPTLRGPGGAQRFFADRGIKWWRSSSAGDSQHGVGPTRSMVSSQVACVNVLLPLAAHPEVLLRIVQHVDPEVEALVPISYTGHTQQSLTSLVDFEFVGVDRTLEGGRYSRGAHATSCDALVLGRAGGRTRAFLMEWKYVEEYVRSVRKDGRARLPRYRERFNASDGPFRDLLPLEELLYDPVYQIVRLGLLGDLMCRTRMLGVEEARLVVVCPEDNAAYRNTVTAPRLKALAGQNATLEQAIRPLWRDPRGFVVTSPEALVAAARPGIPPELSSWGTYLQERYGW